MNNETSKTSTPAAASPLTAKPDLVKNIGGTTFDIHIHFSETSRETFTDKVVRLIKNDSGMKPLKSKILFSCSLLTDPKGTLLPEVGSFLERKLPDQVPQSINFKKSMRYNPLAYIRSEKDILKLVNALILNTKGEGKNPRKISGSRPSGCTIRP